MYFIIAYFAARDGLKMSYALTVQAQRDVAYPGNENFRKHKRSLAALTPLKIKE
jgi:hypothetical protein